MAFNRSDDTLALTPDQHGATYFQPLTDASTALQVTTRIQTEAKTYRVPIVTSTPTAQWTPEGQNIALSDPGTSEVQTTPSKVAALTKISLELVNDSGGEAVNLVQTGMVSDIARKVDEAFFGAPASAEAPAGLRDLVGVQAVDLAGLLTNTDPFSEAMSLAESVGEQITSFVASPATVLRLATLKEGTGSNRPLLTPDVTTPGRRVVQGVPLFSNQFVEDGVVWAIPATAVISVIRTPAEFATSGHGSAFESYSVLARIVQRIGFVVPHAAGIVKITETVTP